MEREIQDAVDHLMKTPSIASLDKAVQEQMRRDLLERARNIATHQGVAALAEFKKQYD